MFQLIVQAPQSLDKSSFVSTNYAFAKIFRKGLWRTLGWHADRSIRYSVVNALNKNQTAVRADVLDHSPGGLAIGCLHFYCHRTAENENYPCEPYEHPLHPATPCLRNDEVFGFGDKML